MQGEINTCGTRLAYTEAGDVMIVGANAVTPLCTSRRATFVTAVFRSPSAGFEKSIPYPPLICTSINPGDITLPLQSMARVAFRLNRSKGSAHNYTVVHN